MYMYVHVHVRDAEELAPAPRVSGLRSPDERHERVREESCAGPRLAAPASTRRGRDASAPRACVRAGHVRDAIADWIYLFARRAS